jgi:hypothetical protein
MDILPTEYFTELNEKIQKLQEQFRIEKYINDLKITAKKLCETKKKQLAIYDETSNIYAICTLHFVTSEWSSGIEYQNVEFERCIINDVGVKLEPTIIPAYKLEHDKLVEISEKKQVISGDDGGYACKCTVTIPIRFLQLND